MVAHGDDFVASGTKASLDWYETELGTFFELKLRGRLSEAPEDLKEIRVLNRIARVVKGGVRYEADPPPCGEDHPGHPGHRHEGSQHPRHADDKARRPD